VARGQHGAVIVVATTEAEIPRARARLRDLGLTAVKVEAPSDSRRLLRAPVNDEAEGAQLVALLRAEGWPAVLRPAAGARLAAWTDHTRPIVIGERLCVSLVWSEHDRRALGPVLELDPAGGFGTGAHPSTRLVLEVLVARITGGERVLDVGCGSGILGLSALRLGASRVVGVDIEAPAVESTRRNAALNNLGPQVEATTAPLGLLEGVFDVVLANIGRAALVELAPELVARVSPAGWLAVSGISPTQCSLAAALLNPLRVLEERTCDEWSMVVMSHGPSATAPWAAPADPHFADPAAP
jgi:precorrin-6B methylase 2